MSCGGIEPGGAPRGPVGGAAEAAAGTLAKGVAPVLAASVVWAACASGGFPTPSGDRTPPAVRIEAPADGSRTETSTPTLEIRYDDAESGVRVLGFRALVNGVDYSAEFDHHGAGATARLSPRRKLPLGVNRLEVEVSDRAGNVGRAASSFVNAGGGWMRVVVPPDAEPRRNVELVLDASGSMADELDLQSRMAVARAAIARLVADVPPSTALGLRVFRDCGDVESLIPIEPVDRARFADELERVEPVRGTPIVASLLEAFDELSRFGEGQRIVVLVTDGGESCGGSLDEAVERARDAATRVIVIGFDIEDAGITAELAELARTTGGAFYDARDPDELRLALEKGVLNLDYVVLDETGREVTRDAVGERPVELPVGVFHIRLATSPPLAVPSVRIGRLTVTTIELRRASSGIEATVLGPVPASGAVGDDRGGGGS